MQKNLQLAFAGVLLSSTCLSSAYSQEASTPPVEVSAEEVTVYATRSAQSTFTVPAMVNKIDADAPGKSTAGTISDLLKDTPGVNVQNGPRRSSQTVSIRGFDDEAIITLMDGRRQNFESGHDGRFFVDPSLLKSVEVVKGSSSAIYGGGAIGGVIAFETKDAADLLEPGQNVGATTSMAYRSATHELSPVVTGYGRYENLDVVASLNYKESHDIKQGDGNKLDTNDHMLSGLFKAGYNFQDFHTVKLNLQTLNHNGEEPSNSAGALTSSNPIVIKDITDNQIGFKYEYENPENSWLQPKAHVYFNNTEVKEHNQSGTYSGRIQSREIETIGLTLDNQSVATISDMQTHTFSYGFEGYQDDQTGTSNDTDGVYSGVPNAEAENFGFYLQDEIALDTGVGDFQIIPAVRYDAYESSDDDGNSQSEDAVSPKLALSYQPTKNYTLFGSWAKAFRAPNLTELYPSGLHFPGGAFFPPDNYFLENPDLKPETVTTFEIGGGLDFDQVVTEEDQLKVKGSYFWSNGEDFITQEVDITAGTTQNLNISNARLEGWEVDAKYQIAAVRANVGLSYVKAWNDDTKEYLDNNIPLTLNVGLNYQIDEIDSIIGWRAEFSDENNKVSSSNETTSGYSVHDIYYRWAPVEGQAKNLTVDLGVDNVFDNAYTNSYASLYEEGRSYVGKVSVKW